MSEMSMAECWEAEWVEDSTYVADVACTRCGAIAERRIVEVDGEAYDECTAALPDGSECGSVEVERP